MTSIIFILGPTAAGKSDVAFNLAEKTGAQIVSCDSMLVYKEPRIISNKPPKRYLDRIKHYFIDIVSVRRDYDVFTYFRYAASMIEEFSIQKVPLIVCGGTGLYAKALLDGIFEGVSRDDSLREELESKAESEGSDVLHKELESVDPVSAQKISSHDTKRIIRALEVYTLTGVPISEKQKEKKGLWGKLPITCVGLTRPRDALYERINTRVDEMFTAGAVDEVKGLLKLNVSRTAQKIIGIKEIGEYLDGNSTVDEAKEAMKKNTRNFAKRQMTWFRAEERLTWLDTESKTEDVLVEEILAHVGKTS